MVPRNAWTRSVYQSYLKMQQRRHAEVPRHQGAHERLRAHYAEANRELAAMFVLDLSVWSSAPASA